jgi:hypothetical protein
MDKQLITQAIDNLNLLDIVLYKSSFERFADIYDESQLGQQNKLAVKADTVKAIDNKNNTIDLLSVFVDLGIRVSDVSQNTEPKLIYQIEATFKVDYQLLNNVDETALIEFSRFNAVHTVWSFWRQFVFSTANQAHLPCPDIPLRTVQAD